MALYQTVKDYRGEKAAQGRQLFFAKHSSPVLVAHNNAAESGPGYFTRQKTGMSNFGASYAARIGFSPDDNYLIIPVVKAEGRPFPERIGVGRTRNTDIFLASNDISKYHAYFTWEGDRWFITDADSSNGTSVDGVRLKPMTLTPLVNGTLIAFGARLHLFMTAAGFFDFL